MNRLQGLLIERGLSQKEVSIAVGVSRPTVSDWVNNKKDPRGENLHKLAELFSVDWRDILVTDPPREVVRAPASGLTDADLAKIADLVQRKHPGIGEAAPRTIEARILAAGVDKMPESDRERALEAMRLIFIDDADYFNMKGEPVNDA